MRNDGQTMDLQKSSTYIKDVPTTSIFDDASKRAMAQKYVGIPT